MTNTRDLEKTYARLGALYSELDRPEMDAERLDGMDNSVSATACRNRRSEFLTEIDRIAADASIDLDNQH